MDPPIRDSESNPKPLCENNDVVYIDTNLDTHLAVLVSDHDTVSDLKERILSGHQSCFPKLGRIQIHAMKVKRKGYFYHLSDSMFVKSAFYGFNKSWFLSVDVSPLSNCGQNDCSSDSPNQLVLLGNSDNALTSLINDKKEEHDFVNASEKAVKDDNVVCEDEMSKSVSSAKEKQMSTWKEDEDKEKKSELETKLQPLGVKEPKEPKQLNEDNLNIVLDQCNETEVGLTDRAEGRREVLQDDPKPMQLEECTPSEQNNNTEANIKE
ncbi:hypothetical protein HN51_021985 [Arachis hypogaea]|uniref:Uncharacterized protein n=2 Tax=Arachis TaxID=3817 RepID=A0A445EDS0_ARAHY|nr:uncharacterized protein LOC107474117 [Arachis duranensis]XP_029147682.1 uncharacterized protein LOC112742179 [Arachis hypogaea]QHO53090.1 telomere-associated protein-like isoform [Arachis hypogaea]RYR73656.1 hypothetical protein Ahy_A02g008100 isoform B [Arachis hypogaea]